MVLGIMLDARLPSRPRDATSTRSLGVQPSRALAREWVQRVDNRRRQAAAWSFIAEAIRGYVEAQGQVLGEPLQVSPLQLALTYKLGHFAAEQARSLGRAVASLPPVQACYQPSATYTALLLGSEGSGQASI